MAEDEPRRWRSVVLLEKPSGYEEIWAFIPGWDPHLKVSVWSETDRKIPEHVRRGFVKDGIDHWYADLRIGADRWRDLGLEDEANWRAG